MYVSVEMENSLLPFIWQESSTHSQYNIVRSMANIILPCLPLRSLSAHFAPCRATNVFIFFFHFHYDFSITTINVCKMRRRKESHSFKSYLFSSAFDVKRYISQLCAGVGGLGGHEKSEDCYTNLHTEWWLLYARCKCDSDWL